MHPATDAVPPSRNEPSRGIVVNDVHSRLNPTVVDSVVTVRSADALAPPFSRRAQRGEPSALIGVDGERRRCSRTENAELFRAALGGYGLFGFVDTVTVRLAPRHKVRRAV